MTDLVDMMNGAMEYTIPPAHKMGIKVVEAGRGYAATSVPLEGNGNHFGVVYAGVQFTVAEILGGIITLASFDSAKYYPLVKNVDIKFTGMARSDLRAEASLDEDEIVRIAAEAAEKGKADFTLDAVVKDEARPNRFGHPRALSTASPSHLTRLPGLRVGPDVPPASAASSPVAESGRCSPTGAARGSPDARARPPRNRPQASPR